jgi:hypothetical protein
MTRWGNSGFGSAWPVRLQTTLQGNYACLYVEFLAQSFSIRDKGVTDKDVTGGT